MTYASEQDAASKRLSPLSRAMLDLRERVFEAWERQVRSQVAQARDVRYPVLINTLPVLYDQIALSVSDDYPHSTKADQSTLAAEHGGERARLTGYDQSALIEEYQVLRRVVFDMLNEARMAVSHREACRINQSIDVALQEAVQAFLLVHNGLRERFAAALTHDMRQPLAAITSSLDLISLLDGQSELKAAVAMAQKGAARMDRMIHELLDTLAFHSGETLSLSLSAFEIGEVVAECRAELAPQDRARLEMVGAPVGGWWDRSAIKRALENLVTNAFKYGSAGTPVTIRVEAVHERLLLAVHNGGEPIAPLEQESIVNMYRRAESARQGKRQGWGIGLPYVRAVAESHGGSMHIDSGREHGTTFVIDIPLDGRPFRGAPTLALS